MWFNLKCVNPLTDKYKPEELLDFLVSDLPLKKKKKKCCITSSSVTINDHCHIQMLSDIAFLSMLWQDNYIAQAGLYT